MEGRQLFMKTLGSCKTPGCAPNGPKHNTWSIGQKDGVAAPWQILDANFWPWFMLIPNSFWRETTWIGFLIKLAFHSYVDRQKRSLYVSWVTSLRQTGPGGRGRLEFLLDRPSGLCWTSLLVIFASISSSKFLMTLSNVPKKYNIIR